MDYYWRIPLAVVSFTLVMSPSTVRANDQKFMELFSPIEVFTEHTNRLSLKHGHDRFPAESLNITGIYVPFHLYDACLPSLTPFYR